MKKKTCLLLFIFILAVCFVTCKSVSNVIDAGTQFASSTGLFDQNIIDAISTTNRAISSAAEQIEPEQEYYIGRAVAANILSKYRIWNGNPELTNYLNLICTAITINSPRPDVFNGYHVAILDSSEFNAFATSGGHIFVTRGLIDAARSEDELAAVIAHEIAHIQLQHSIKAIRTSRITQALAATSMAVTGVATGMNVNELTDIFNETIGNIVESLVNNGYSRDQEFEADTTALSLLAGAGYNPSALVDILTELTTVQSRAAGGFNTTHPTPIARSNNANRYVNSYRLADNRMYREPRFAEKAR